MNCPDIDRLIDFLAKGGPEAELEAHLQACPSCRADLQLLREIPAAVLPEMEVPDILVQRVLDETAPLRVLPEGHRVPAAQVAAGILLGVLTTFGTLVATGSGGGGGPAAMLVMSLGVGLGAGFVLSRAARRALLGQA